MFYGDGDIMPTKKKYCGEYGCDGVMKITYVKRRVGGDVVRTRKCSECKTLTHTIEVERDKYERMRKLVKELQISYSKFTK